MNIQCGRSVIMAALASLIPVCLPLSRGAAAQTPNQEAGAPSRGNAGEGKTAFAVACSFCHGDQGEGAMGPQIAGLSLAFSNFTNQVRKGKGAMPPFDSATLTDAQLADIYAFLKSLPSAPAADSAPAPPTSEAALPSSASAAAPAADLASSIPGNGDRGKISFVSENCSKCHGRDGQGGGHGRAPRAGPPEMSSTAFVAYVRHPTGKMPAYAAKALPDQELADIYAFLQTMKPPAAAKTKDAPSPTK